MGKMLPMPFLQDGGCVARGHVVGPCKDHQLWRRLTVCGERSRDTLYSIHALHHLNRDGKARRGATWSHAKNRAARIKTTTKKTE